MKKTFTPKEITEFSPLVLGKLVGATLISIAVDYPKDEMLKDVCVTPFQKFLVELLYDNINIKKQ